MKHFTFSPARATKPWLAIGAIAVALGCHGDSIVALDTAALNTHTSAHVGDRIDVTLQSIGPGEYASPPTLSSPAVAFLGVGYCGAVPAGATQCFHFRAASPGQAVLTFIHSGNNGVVHDTIDVR